MAKKRTPRSIESQPTDISPLVAATLTGIIYQTRLFNRQARMNVPEDEVILEVVDLWRTVEDVLSKRRR